jgi:hypothetical protein
MPNNYRKRSAPVRIDETMRRKLEALREDCRRHAEAPVPLECVEGPHEGASALELAHRAGMLQPIAWGWSRIAGGPSESLRAYVGMAKGDPEDRARALVERLGDLVIREPVLAASAGAELPKLLAGKPSALLVGAVLIRGSVAPDESSVLAPAPAGGPRPRARTITLEEFAGELEAAPKLGTRRVWRVPCVRAAIAEVCDAILGSSEVPARVSAFLPPCDNAARLLLELNDLTPEGRLKGEKIAKRLKVQERRVRELVRELVDQGWPIEPKPGRNGGARLIRERLSAEQRDWLERAAP